MMAMDRDDPAMQLLWSPMTKQGQARYDTVRAAIRAVYGPGNQKPQTTEQRLTERYTRAAHRSADDIFFEAFGSHDQLMHGDGGEDDICAGIFQRGGQQQQQQQQRQYQPEPEAEARWNVPTTTSTFASSHAAAVANGTTAAAAMAPSFGYQGALSSLSHHVSQLPKPTRLKTPKRFSLKRMRMGESSAEKELVLRKPRISLSDTTNLMHASTTTTTMSNPWDRHGGGLGSSYSSTVHATTICKPFGVPQFRNSSQPTATTTTTAAFGSMSTAPFVQRPSPVKMTSSITSTRAFALR